jgi:hypothetical protein
MEDWDTYMVLILPYLMSFSWIPLAVKELLAPLWLAVAFFMRYRPGQEAEAHIDAAQEALLDYASKVQKIFKLKKLATLQLHTCAVHLPRAAKAWGPTRFCLEYWLEHMVQACADLVAVFHMFFHSVYCICFSIAC